MQIDFSICIAEMEDYMKNLADTKHGVTDMILAPAHTDALVDKTSEEDTTTPAEWALPCHSIILSAHSSVFAASDRHNQNDLKTECTKDGKRIMRLPLSEQAARRLLQFLYGSACEPKTMSLSEACQLAVISDMKDIQGGESQHLA